MQPTQVFGDILTALAEQDDELDGLLAGLDDAGWARPSRCPDWSICDVVLHLAQTDEMALASAERRFTDVVTEFGRPPGAQPGANVDDLAGLAVAAGRGRPPAEVYQRWRQAAAAEAKALAACEAGTRVPWVSGELSALTLATTRLAEHWIHTGDVAEALDRPPVATDRLRPVFLIEAVSSRIVTADELATKNVEAKGGIEKVHALQSVRLSGRMRVQGDTIELGCVTLVTWSPRPPLHSWTRLPDAPDSSGCDGGMPPRHPGPGA